MTKVSEKTREEAFQKLIDELNKGAGAGGRFYHPTPGDTKIRLVLLEDDTEMSFWREVINKWGSTKYLVAAVILDAPDRAEDAGPEMRGVVLAKTALSGILGNLKAGWELFDPKTGHGVCITREGTGKFDTTYQVNLSPQSVDITEFDYEIPEGDLDDWAEAYNSMGNDDAPSNEPIEKPEKKKSSNSDIPW